MKSNTTMILAGAAAGVGGHYIGSSMDATTPPSSTLMSKSVLIPGVAGILGYFLLRKKNASAAKGLLYGGLAGAAWGFMSASGAAGGMASTGSYAGTAPATGAYLGGPRHAVARILNSPSGSGLGNILPKSIQSGNPAFKSNAWARR